MNITQFTKYLNKQKGWNVDPSYYTKIEIWKQWWYGHVPEVHDIEESDADGVQHERHMACMRMPKRACCDWASLLINDKTTISLGDEASAEWLLGNQDQTGGLLHALNFWPEANGLVELAFRSGTGAFVLSAENMLLKHGIPTPSKDAQICLDYDPAECILPLTVRHGVVTEVAFASQVLVSGKSCIYLQTHTRVPNPAGGMQYRISNEYYTSKGEDTDNATYLPAPLPPGVVASFDTGADVPLFALFRPADKKNIPGGTGLGMAVFSEALDQAKQVDLAFDNYHQDLFLGGKKVFYSGKIVKSVIREDGSEVHIPPDDVRRQQFFQLPEGDPDTNKEWHEYNPDLRVDDNRKAVQDALNYFSFKCGLGAHRYRFSADGVKTATEYNGSRQDLVQNANRHQTQIESALIQIVRAMLWAGKNILGENVDPDTEISIHFDDSYITDSETRRQQDKEDALDGFIPKYRYNMEWRGMNEEDAKRAVAEARQEGQNRPEISFGGDA